MVFSSVEFLLYFLPIFLILYGLTPEKMKNAVLLSGSLIFYALGDVRYLPLLMVSVLINYFLGLRLGNGTGTKQTRAGKETGQRQKSKTKEEITYRNYAEQRLRNRHKLLLMAAISFNVGVLAAFKYFIKGSLPLGISFYTFQIMSYLIDVYRGEQEGENSFVRFATYVIMFPQLVSGPIVRYEEVRPALNKRRFTVRGIEEGLKVFVVGLAAKVLLADTIGLLWRDAEMVGYESISTQLAWLAAIAYSLMLYFDFCGYSLMAIGLGRMLGFELPVNFQTPYMATTVRDFYRRWHMTLGRWFTKYIYIPLGGNRKGVFRTVCNLLVVWLLTAVWHGSTTNFLIWGMLLWLAIVFERLMESMGLLPLLEKGPGKVISHLYLWVVIPVSWMCFAISDVQQLQIYLGRMFGVVPGIMVSRGDWIRALQGYWWLLLAGLAACTPMVMKLFKRFKDTLPGGIILAILFWLCVWRLQKTGQNPFLYRDF